jgi:SAM-dependent methyltransferase
VLNWLTQEAWERESLAERRVLDLACGTGAAALVFAQAGCQVVGVDRSAAMLEQARQKTSTVRGNLTLLQTDMRDLESVPLPAHSFDLVTCFFDSLNYLLDDSDLQRVCAGVATVLKPGGFFIFDLNTEVEFLTWEGYDQVVYDGSQHMVYNRLDYNHRQGIATGRIVWLSYHHNRWWRSEETHHERAWSEDEIRAALAAGGPRSSDQTSTGQGRLHLVARRTPQGEEAAEHAPRIVYVVRAQ